MIKEDGKSENRCRNSSASNIQQWFLFLAVLSLLSGWSYTTHVFDMQNVVSVTSDKAGDSGSARYSSGSTHLTVAATDSMSKKTAPAHTPSTSANTVSMAFQRSPIRRPRDLFDCDQDSSSCVYFSPSTYFEASTSPLPPRILDSVKNYWSNKVNFTSKKELFWFSIGEDVGVYNLVEWNSNATSSPPQGWPRTLMGLHVHKCGGSSVGRTFGRLANNGHNATNLYDLTLFYKHNLRKKIRQPSWEQDSVEMHTRLLQQVFEDQQTGALADHVAFTFVRDPVERFLASVREFLVSRNRRGLCLDAKSDKEVLQCFLSKLQLENGLQLDQHFAAMTMSLYMYSLIEPRIRMSIIPLTKDTMAEFQTALLGPQRRTIKAKSSKPQNHNISIEALDEKMTQDICILYQMDVYLMQSLGIPTPRCNSTL